MIAYGTALVDDDPNRIGQPTAVGLDETLFKRTGEFHRLHRSTSIVDVPSLTVARDAPPRPQASRIGCRQWAGASSSHRPQTHSGHINAIAQSKPSSRGSASSSDQCTVAVATA